MVNLLYDTCDNSSLIKHTRYDEIRGALWYDKYREYALITRDSRFLCISKFLQM